MLHGNSPPSRYGGGDSLGRYPKLYQISAHSASAGQPFKNFEKFFQKNLKKGVKKSARLCYNAFEIRIGGKFLYG
jgi:hypothetical protein